MYPTCLFKTNFWLQSPILVFHGFSPFQKAGVSKILSKKTSVKVAFCVGMSGCPRMLKIPQVFFFWSGNWLDSMALNSKTELLEKSRVSQIWVEFNPFQPFHVPNLVFMKTSFASSPGWVWHKGAPRFTTEEQWLRTVLVLRSQERKSVKWYLLVKEKTNTSFLHLNVESVHPILWCESPELFRLRQNLSFSRLKKVSLKKWGCRGFAS